MLAYDRLSSPTSYKVEKMSGNQNENPGILDLYFGFDSTLRFSNIHSSFQYSFIQVGYPSLDFLNHPLRNNITLAKSYNKFIQCISLTGTEKVLEGLGYSLLEFIN